MMEKTTVITWKLRRGEILKALHEKMHPIGHLHEFPVFDDSEKMNGMDAGELEELYTQQIKNCILGEYTKYLYPYCKIDEKENRIRFKIPTGLSDSLKERIKLFSHFLRYVAESRVYLSHLLAKKLNLGMIARSVGEIIRDFIHIDVPPMIESIFKANDTLPKVNMALTNLEADFKVLSVILKRIVKYELIGGQIISLLDRPENQQMSRSCIPGLVNQCISSGMQHYNNFLEEFLYNGDLKSDRQHEFMIWDLSKTKKFTAADFGHHDKEFFDELPFNHRFVIIADLIPSTWKKEMISLVYQTRKIVSILISETHKPFPLPYTKITDLSSENQNEVIVEKNEYAGKALVKKIDSVFNIQEFYGLLFEMIFNPSASWLSYFVESVEELTTEVELDDSDADKFNRLYLNFFHLRCQNVKEDLDIVKMKLYEYSMFENVLPLDKRFVDYIPISTEEEKQPEGTLFNDENQRPSLNKSVSLEDNTKTKSDSDPVSSIKDYESETEQQVEVAPLPYVERIGIEFNDFILFKCLVPPTIQEHLNRLFRLRFTLVRANILLLQKRYSSDSESLFNNRCEQIFITFVQNFISRYTFYVFGVLCEQHWKNFMSTVPHLKNISTITEAQRLFLININSMAGLYNNSQKFSDHLSHVFQIINDYCGGELSFNNAADKFYATYKRMRAIACSKKNEYLNEMSYEVFRVPALVPFSRIEKIEIDPRQGLVAVPNMGGATSTMRRSLSCMNIRK